MYECKHCNKSYPTKNSLARHAHNHQSIAQHRCNICGVEFRRRDILLRHGKIHANELAAAADFDDPDAVGEARKRRRCHTACQNCRKARSKCDGELPCSSCKVTRKECTYGQNSLRLSQRPALHRADSNRNDISIPGDSSHPSDGYPSLSDVQRRRQSVAPQGATSAIPFGTTFQSAAGILPDTFPSSDGRRSSGTVLAEMNHQAGPGGYKWHHPIQIDPVQSIPPSQTLHLPPLFQHHGPPSGQIQPRQHYDHDQHHLSGSHPGSVLPSPALRHTPPTAFQTSQALHHHSQQLSLPPDLDRMAIPSIVSGQMPSSFSELDPNQEFNLSAGFDQSFGGAFALSLVDVPDWPWLHQETFLRTDHSSLWLSQSAHSGQTMDSAIGTGVMPSAGISHGQMLPTGHLIGDPNFAVRTENPNHISGMSFPQGSALGSGLPINLAPLPPAQQTSSRLQSHSTLGLIPQSRVPPAVPTDGLQLRKSQLFLNGHLDTTSSHPLSPIISSAHLDPPEQGMDESSHLGLEPQPTTVTGHPSHGGFDALSTVAHASGPQREVIQTLLDYVKRVSLHPVVVNNSHLVTAPPQVSHRDFWSTISSEIDEAFCPGAGTRHGRPTLDRFIDLYFQHFHPLWTIVLQPPGMDPATLAPFLYVTMASIGAMYDSPHGVACGAILHESLRDMLMAHQFDFAESETEPLWLIQSMILTQLAALYFGHRRAFSAAQHIGCILISHARRLKLFSVQRYRHNHLTAINRCRHPDQRYRLWIRLQIKVRLAFSIFRSDAYMSTLLNTRPLMSSTEMEVDPSMYVFNQAKLTDMDGSIEKALEEHNKRRVIQLSDVVRISLDRRERLPSDLGPGEHEIMLFALQSEVWEYCHDPGAAARLSTLHVNPEARNDYVLSDHPDFASFEQPPEFRRMDDLRIDSARLTSALGQWERSFMRLSLRVAPPGSHRPMMVTSLLLYHLTFIRMHAPVEALHRLSYSLDDHPAPSIHGLMQAHPQDTADLLRALFGWSSRPQAATAVRHAIQIWRLIRAELSRPARTRVKLNLMAFIGLHHGSVVVWAYAVSQTRENTKFVLPACDAWATDAGPGINSAVRGNRRRGWDRGRGREREMEMEFEIETDSSPDRGGTSSGQFTKSGMKRRRPRSWSTGSRLLDITDEEELIRDRKINVYQSSVAPAMEFDRAAEPRRNGMGTGQPQNSTFPDRNRSDQTSGNIHNVNDERSNSYRLAQDHIAPNPDTVDPLHENQPSSSPPDTVFPSFPDVPETGIPLCREEIHGLLSAYASLYEYISPTWSLKSTFAEAAWRLARREPPPMMSLSTGIPTTTASEFGVRG